MNPQWEGLRHKERCKWGKCGCNLGSIGCAPWDGSFMTAHLSTQEHHTLPQPMSDHVDKWSFSSLLSLYILPASRWLIHSVASDISSPEKYSLYLLLKPSIWKYRSLCSFMRFDDCRMNYNQPLNWAQSYYSMLDVVIEVVIFRILLMLKIPAETVLLLLIFWDLRLSAVQTLSTLQLKG